MGQLRLLDLFSGEGGAGMGYHQAGFEVVGVDIDPQPRYHFEFHQADAFEYLNAHGDEFDVIHASPPCPAYSTITPDPTRHPRLIGRTRRALTELGRPYVIENVDGAKRQLDNPFMLCGSAFGLQVRRHRWFESSAWVVPAPCRHAEQGQPVGVYGDHPETKAHPRRGRPGGRGIKATDLAHAQQAMGMPWASWRGCAEAIPPAYTRHIGGQLVAALI